MAVIMSILKNVSLRQIVAGDFLSTGTPFIQASLFKQAPLF